MSHNIFMNMRCDKAVGFKAPTVY